jgi:hypothetical protein
LTAASTFRIQKSSIVVPKVLKKATFGSGVTGNSGLLYDIQHRIVVAISQHIDYPLKMAALLPFFPDSLLASRVIMCVSGIQSEPDSLFVYKAEH